MILELFQEKYGTAKKYALNYINQFKKDFESELFPIIYAAELLNISICLNLISSEINQAKNYIANRARALGCHIPVESQLKHNDDDEILQYTDHQTENLNILDNLENRFSFYWLKKMKTEETKWIAIEILSTLCNSASVEREFSKAKNIKTMKRLRLLPALYEDLVLISCNKELATKYL